MRRKKTENKKREDKSRKQQGLRSSKRLQEKLQAQEKEKLKTADSSFQEETNQKPSLRISLPIAVYHNYLQKKKLKMSRRRNPFMENLQTPNNKKTRTKKPTRNNEFQNLAENQNVFQSVQSFPNREMTLAQQFDANNRLQLSKNQNFGFHGVTIRKLSNNKEQDSNHRDPQSDQAPAALNLSKTRDPVPTPAPVLSADEENFIRVIRNTNINLPQLNMIIANGDFNNNEGMMRNKNITETIDLLDDDDDKSMPVLDPKVLEYLQNQSESNKKLIGLLLNILTTAKSICKEPASSEMILRKLNADGVNILQLVQVVDACLTDHLNTYNAKAKLLTSDKLIETDATLLLSLSNTAQLSPITVEAPADQQMQVKTKGPHCPSQDIHALVCRPSKHMYSRNQTVVNQQPTQQHVQQPAQQHAQQLTQQHAQQPAQQYAQQLTQQHAQQLTQQHVQQPSQQHVQQLTQQHAQQLTQQRVQQLTQQHVQQPAQQHVQQPYAKTQVVASQQNHGNVCNVTNYHADNLHINSTYNQAQSNYQNGAAATGMQSYLQHQKAPAGYYAAYQNQQQLQPQWPQSYYNMQRSTPHVRHEYPHQNQGNYYQ